MNARRAISVILLVAAGAGLTPASPRAQRAAPVKPSLEVLPTALLVRDGETPQRIVRLVVELPEGAKTQASIKAWLGGRPIVPDPAPVPVGPGRNAFDVKLPEPAKPVKARFEVRLAGAAAPAPLGREITLAPARRWSVYLFHHSHTDIGYTELQSRVTKNHVEYLDSVIKYCRETDAYPDDAKFRWNIEVAWALENFVKTRPEADVRALVDLIRAGRVELSALYLQLSDCFAPEEIVRTLDAAKDFAGRYGFVLRSAMNDDVNGFAWSLPQIFRQAGVRYFATGINETRSRAPLRRPNAFWWESPDGSRILHWNGEHYLFGNYDLLLHEAIDRSAPKVGEYLARLEARGDYPQDIIAFNIGAWTTDNCPPGRQLSDRVKEWNERYESPKLRLATLREFFERMEKDYGPTLPVHRLGWPDYWTDGVGSTAFETGLNRIAHNEILTAEKISAVAAVLDPAGAFRFPADEIRAGQAAAMLYDEHTWGAYNSIDAPWSELARGQWAAKSGFAYDAREISRTVLRRGQEALARLLNASDGPAFAVFNPLSWARTDAVRVPLPSGPLREAQDKLRVVDRRTGREAKFQRQGDDALLVLAENVPPLGFVLFAVETGAAPAAAGGAAVTAGGTIENRFYRIAVDPKTGGLASLFDKELGRELVDPAAPWPLNAYIYEQPEGGRAAVDDMTKRAVFRRWTAESAKVEPGERGPVATGLIVRSAPKMCASLEQRIVLYDDVKRVDLVDVLDKEETFHPEAVYFAFPFKVSASPVPPAVRFELAGADMAPGAEQLPGTTLDWQTAQHWVEFSGRDARVVWSPVEAPLVQFGDINTGKWQKTFAPSNAWIFSYAMNNYWMTNFKASQEGRIEFRYSLTSGPAVPTAAGAPPAPDRVASTRFGWEVHTPLVAAWIPAGAKGPIEGAEGSALSVDAPNVLVQALWLDADGTPVVRLREIAGRPAEGRLTSAVFLGSGAVPLRLRPFELQTVRLAR
ncbi:MAG TPA: glycoside hydrolase family 38 C-terminal domain-containing protein [Acidobacteriota bacterium]|nr:glycoside hydrolase family 38 C-terminal domain-containing protein [Acidobacteriota bacterium]